MRLCVPLCGPLLALSPPPASTFVAGGPSLRSNHGSALHGAMGMGGWLRSRAPVLRMRVLAVLQLLLPMSSAVGEGAVKSCSCGLAHVQAVAPRACCSLVLHRWGRFGALWLAPLTQWDCSVVCAGERCSLSLSRHEHR